MRFLIFFLSPLMLLAVACNGCGNNETTFDPFFYEAGGSLSADSVNASSFSSKTYNLEGSAGGEFLFSVDSGAFIPRIEVYEDGVLTDSADGAQVSDEGEALVWGVNIHATFGEGPAYSVVVTSTESGSIGEFSVYYYGPRSVAEID